MIKLSSIYKQQDYPLLFDNPNRFYDLLITNVHEILEKTRGLPESRLLNWLFRHFASTCKSVVSEKKTFIDIPISKWCIPMLETYVKTLSCGGGHFWFLINTKWRIGKGLSNYKYVVSEIKIIL